MPTIALRPQGTDLLEVHRFSTQDEARAFLVEMSNQPQPPRMYRVIMQQDGDIVFRPLRKVPGSEVVRTVVADAQFEDDV